MGKNYPVIDLCGTWQLRQTADKAANAIPAQIPGDNYSALLENELIPDPYYRENEKDVQWVADKDWTYERSFTVPQELLQAQAVILNLDSVDAVATLYINNKEVAKLDDQFLRFRKDVKPFLKVGKNAIRLDFVAVTRAGDELKKTQFGHLPGMGPWSTIPTLNYVRKTQCSAGWDWGISLPTTGMTGKLYLEGVDQATLDHVYDVQIHKKNSCEVTLFAELTPLEDTPIGTKVTVEFFLDGQKKKATGVVPRQGKILTSVTFTVKNPQLWWPNGYGEQPLYPLQVTCNGQVVTQKLALKELKVVNEKDDIGFCMIFQVNGVRIFAKGADWIPCDAMPQRHTPERYQNLLESVAKANMNMLRVWGGGKFEEDTFYEECDRLGILLWHDNMFSCALYPDQPHFLQNIHDEIVYQVKRLRHHACIGLWCGDNELIGNVNNAPDAKLRDEYLVFYDRLSQTVGRAIREADDTHTFWPSSPCAGPNNYANNWLADADGDMHYWKVWHGGAVFENYYEVRPRFCSEFGFQSFPSLETVETFAEKEDFNVFSPVFDRHQKAGQGGNANIVGMFGNYFMMPNSFQGMLYLSQIQQGLAIRTGVEFWHSLRPRCMGTIFWQLNDNWPVSSWASLEYTGRWKALQYMAKRFYAPIQTVAYHTKPEDPMEMYFITDLPGKVDAKIVANLLDVTTGKTIVKKEFVVKADTMGAISLEIPDFYHDDKARKGRAIEECVLLVTTTAKDQNGKKYSHQEIVTLVPWKKMPLPQAKVTVTDIKMIDKQHFQITLDTDKPAFFLWLALKNDPTAIFEDNAITLLPGKTTLTLTTGKEYTAAKVKKELTTFHLRETY